MKPHPFSQQNFFISHVHDLAEDRLSIPANSFTKFINDTTHSVSEIEKRVSNFQNPIDIQKDQLNRSDNQDNFWKLLLTQSPEKITHFLTPSLNLESDSYPNLAAWCLSINSDFAIDMFFTTHIPENIYDTKNFSIVGEVIKATQHHDKNYNPGIFYEKVLSVFDKLIEVNILQFSHLDYLKTQKAQELLYVWSLISRTLNNNFGLKSLYYSHSLKKTEETENKQNIEPAAPNPYPHITYQNLFENLQISLEAKILLHNTNSPENAQPKKSYKI